MSIDTSGSAITRELPRKPISNGVNVSNYGDPTEYAFENIYGMFHAEPYFSEAKKAYLSKTLNRRNESGVNTWHEQLIAGRITPDDMKIIGYTNIGKLHKYSKDMLLALTDDRNPMDARTLRAAIDAANNSHRYGTSDPVLANPKMVFPLTLWIAQILGPDTVREVHNHIAIHTGIRPTLEGLARKDKAAAQQLIRYVDSYYDELRAFRENHNHVYNRKEFLILMKAGITPRQAAEYAVRGLSVERAVEAQGLTPTLTEGVL